MNVVYIYNGDGSEKTDVLMCSLKENLSNTYNTEYISAQNLNGTKWLENGKLLILPGGRDLPYVRDITPNALQNIKTFIQNGGSFLGICAGAYFSCDYVCFEKDTPLEVTGQRNLNLFRGIAKGSVYPGFKYSSTAGSRTVPLLSHCDYHNNEIDAESFAYFNGGCEFIPDENFTDFQPLFSYKDFMGKNAIVLLKVGNGKAVLSGVHLEIDVKYLDCKEYSESQWNTMREHVESSRSLFQWILRCLFIG